MYTAMDVGILLSVHTINRLNHTLWLLCRSTAIEIDEWLAVHLT